jgi:hypothetical protein
MTQDNDKDERAGDTGRNPSKKGKGTGAEKGDHRREYRQHSGQTRNSPSGRREENDEQSGHRGT